MSVMGGALKISDKHLLLVASYTGKTDPRRPTHVLEAELRRGCGSDGPRVVEHESDVPMLLAGVDF